MPEPRSSIPVPDPASHLPLARGSTQQSVKSIPASRVLRSYETLLERQIIWFPSIIFSGVLFLGVSLAVFWVLCWRSRFSAIKNQGKLNVRRRKIEIEPPTWGESLSNMNTYLKFESFLKWVSFLFFSSSATFFISKLLTRGATATATLLYSSREFSTVILRNQFRAQNLSEYRYTV